ncbi:hypothetical protein TPHA_0F00310 [Tetrapisispora phaffii CBS 4417]|uniref:Uncharacterized protein n=1 Tax=Tetrapisispora phaffii (strain ATCC 24235 / CBS 4417 / NBRC 1672 / NRRL Y-8282 / UCD 70-5) TaxID=1071381 RepID=G8BUT6_TETPH|nr:hypothetical protein TPHA_0F00310 [Tetrapisispora phaffii CBS 4417]CCE63518.1 hypothetical protein TPHA_0F00310 [Tetrapisispora phaffii CBS 4417]
MIRNRMEQLSIYKIRFLKFRQSHTLYVLYLTAVAALQFIAIAFFTKGFLLSRNVLDDINELKPSMYAANSSNNGFVHQQKFEKTVILVIDALRFDFVIPVNTNNSAYNSNHHNKITTLYDQFCKESVGKKQNNSLLLKFLADPPTTTLQRLKGLTTGSLPTFIDAGSNFDGTVIEEDNLIKQMYLNNKEVFFVGDDTWDALFSPFLSNHSIPYESLNVWDLDTVDNGVISYFNDNLIRSEEYKKKNSQWNVLIGHMLGVDHVGHKYGPNHFTMKEKQLQVNNFINDIINVIDDDTLLVIMGDHGMDHTGNHGGDSIDELESTLFLYSKRQNVWKLEDDHSVYNIDDLGSNYKSINQIDLVPTLALLLDIPIPFNNLGWPIKEIAVNELEQQFFSNITLDQLKKYQETNGLFPTGSDKYRMLENLFNTSKENYELSKEYQAYLLMLCKDLWANFEFPSIAIGIIFLFLSLIILITTTKLIPSIVVSQMVPIFVPLIIMMIFVSHLCLFSLFYVFQPPAFIEERFWCSLLATAIGITLACFSQIFERYSLKWLIFRFFGELSDYWSRVGSVFIILHAVIFTSNSFTIWEDRIISFFIATIGLFTMYEFIFVPNRESTSALLSGVLIAKERDSKKIRNFEEEVYSDCLPLTKIQRALGIYHSLILICCTRISSFITICREEQGDFCTPTFSTSSNYSINTIGILFVLMIVVPFCIQGYYNLTSSFQGSAPIWINLFLRLVLFGVFCLWGLNTVENYLNEPILEINMFKISLARSLAGVSLIALNFGWIFGPLCVNLGITRTKENSKENSATILGVKNIYGSQYFLLVLNIFMAVMIFSKPLAQISLYLMLNQILSVIEIIDMFKLKENIIGPVILNLIAYQHFFTTGHQATIPAVQWDAGFILSETISFPLTHIAIFLNTFGPQVLASVAIALFTLWKQPPLVLKPQTMLGRIVSNCGCLLIYNTVLCLSTFIWVTHFRRHLMVWKIFCPRFIFASLSLIVTQIIVILITIAFASGRLIRQINSFFWEF